MKLSFFQINAVLIQMFICSFSFAQNGFVWQNPKPQGNILYSVKFISPTTGWAGGDNGTVMKTTDGGITWVKQKTGTTAALTSIFFIDENTGWGVGSNTVIKTTNGGSTWSVLTTTAPTALSCVCFFDANTGIISGYGQIFRTTDGGKTLTSVAGGTLVNYSNMLSVFFANKRKGWAAGTSGRVLSTIDGGLTWSAQTSNTTIRLNSVFFTDSINGYVYGDSGTRLVTSNGGSTWTFSKVLYNHINSTCFIDGQTGWAVTESNSDSTTIYKTRNGGTSWTSYWTGSNRALTSVCFRDSLRGWAVGHGGRMLWTTNGGTTWNAASSGMTTPLINVHFINPLTGWAVGEQGATMKTTDGGTTWIAGKIPNSSYLNDVWFINKDTGIVVAGFGTNQIYRTNDGGKNWKTVTTPKTNYFLNGVHFGNGNTGWSVGYNGVILKSINLGESWSELNSGSTKDLYAVHFFKPKKTGTRMNYNDTLGFAVGYNGTILKTTDGGSNWNSQVSGTTVTLETVFFIDSLNGWCAGQSGTVLRTQNGGLNWQKQTSNIYNTIYGIQFLDNNTGYAVGDYGYILKTTNGGENWTILTSGTANTLYSLWFTDAATGYIVGKYGTILKTTDGGISFIQDIRSSESVWTIYPNPATRKIYISKNGESTGKSVITIFDMKGNAVTQSKFENQKMLKLDVSSFKKGMYLITIDTDKGTESKKLLIQ